MVSSARDATPNAVLYNLRDAAGQTQQDVADALNRLGARRRRNVAVTANQVSRWERGVTHPSALYRQLLAEHFGVTIEELGLNRPRVTLPTQPRRGTLDGLGIAEIDPQQVIEPATQQSWEKWRAVRRRLNLHRVPLAREAAWLYDAEARVGDTGLIASSAWLPSAPVDLADVAIARTSDTTEPMITGSEDASAPVRPLATGGTRHARYSLALRDVEQPRLFENRLAWRLSGVDWTQAGGALSFATGTYFGGIDLAEALAHEMAAHHVPADGSGPSPASWRGLSLRRLIGDPFDASRRPIYTSTDTLTLRRDDDGVTFVLHNRSAKDVAIAGGTLHIMPAGVFQPSSILPGAQVADFDLWLNIAREYSEEFLGNAEHGGDGEPADYTAEPLASLVRARQSGDVRVYCLGVGLDALTLWGEIMTVAVFEADAYDRLFGSMVAANNEGAVVTTGTAKPTSALPFTSHMIDELCGSGRLAPAAAGCLRLTWEHRRAILGRR